MGLLAYYLFKTKRTKHDQPSPASYLIRHADFHVKIGSTFFIPLFELGAPAIRDDEFLFRSRNVTSFFYSSRFGIKRECKMNRRCKHSLASATK